MTLQDELAGFFESYVDAFARRDADALSDLWEPVGLFPSPAGNFAMDRQALRDHCVTLMSFYREQGVVRPAGELLSTAELFPHVAQARTAYRMHGEGDTVTSSPVSTFIEPSMGSWLRPHQSLTTWVFSPAIKWHGSSWRRSGRGCRSFQVN